MSFKESTVWTIECDGGCARMRTGSGRHQRLAARVEARGMGWHHKADRDICPACWKEGVR